MVAELTVTIDRDSVAMGDDMESHRRTMTVPTPVRLSVLLARVAPEIRQRGWSWVVDIGGEAVAVWSADHGVRLLVADRELAADSPLGTIVNRYFGQIDPGWLHRRLSEGAPANRCQLEREYEPLARRARAEEDRRRERERPGGFVGEETLAQLSRLAAVIDLHHDRKIAFEVGGVRWEAERSDTMMTIRRDGRPRASLRPHAFGEVWLVVAVVVDVRERRGLRPCPEAPLRAAREPVAVAGRFFLRGGPPDGNLEDDAAVAIYRLAAGRTVTEAGDLIGA
ncbi:hypothetical protein [Microbacterium gorillae]|uniref:hypothetical protein n=1 Tax=Microbacterium gorillae TaxID=1231063 RepID=UPI00058BBF40|nr:hypothetical protein [Microbacterium gorillae]